MPEHFSVAESLPAARGATSRSSPIRAAVEADACRAGGRLLLVAATLLSLLLIGVEPNSNDERQNLTAAYNLATFGTLSVEASGEAAPPPDMRREPLYPGVLALVLIPGQPSLDCLLASGSECTGRLVALRLVNVGFLLAAVALTHALARRLLRPRWALATAALVAATPALARYSDSLLTEPAAAAFLLAGTLCLLRTADGGAALRWAFLAGLCFGALVLLKAIFLLVLPPLALVVAVAARRPTLRNTLLGVCMLAGAVVVVGPLSARNLAHFGSIMPSSGSGYVLAVRAESLDMTPLEALTGCVYSTALVGPPLASLIFDEEDYRRHDRTNPDSFYRRALGWSEGDSDKLSAAAVAAIREQPVRHALLTLPFAWSGAFGASPTGLPAPDWWPLPLRHAWLVLVVISVVVRWLAVLAVGVLLMRGLRDRRVLLLLAPSVLLFLAYATTTHFIPRYTQPALPVAYIALFIVAQRRWSARALSTARTASAP